MMSSVRLEEDCPESIKNLTTKEKLVTIQVIKFREQGGVKDWSIGVLEYWVPPACRQTGYSIIPSLHYSKESVNCESLSAYGGRCVIRFT